MAEGMDLFIDARLASDVAGRITTDPAVTFKALLAATIISQAAAGLRTASISIIRTAPGVAKYSQTLLNQLGYKTSFENNQLMVAW
jgi:hypothetical protein